MTKLNLSTAVVLLVLASAAPLVAAPTICKSPDGAIAIEFDLRKDGASEGVPHYRIRN